MLELALVMALLERSARGAQLGEPFLVLDERAFELGELLALLLDLLRARARLAREALDLALSRENSGVGGVRGVEADAEAAELMALAIHQHDVRREPHAGEEARRVLDGVIGSEPRRDHRAHGRLRGLDVVRERRQPLLAPQLGVRPRAEGAHP